MTITGRQSALVELVREKVTSVWTTVLYLVHLNKNLEKLDKQIADLAVRIRSVADKIEAYVKSVSADRAALAIDNISLFKLDRVIRRNAATMRETLKELKQEVDALELRVLHTDMMLKRNRSISEPRLVHLDSILGDLRRADDALAALNAQCELTREKRRGLKSRVRNTVRVLSRAIPRARTSRP